MAIYKVRVGNMILKKGGLSTGGSVTMKLTHLVVPLSRKKSVDLGKARGSSTNQFSLIK